MAKKTAKQKKKASKKKKVARRPAGRAAAPKPKRKAKTVSKKKTVSKAKQAPRRKVAAKPKKKVKASPKARAPKTSRARSAKRKPVARHPPLDLRRFRRRLLERQAELLQAYISTKVDSRSREIDGTEDYIDYAVSSYDREFLLSLTELEQNQLSLVEAAIKRLDDREFGLCTQCERPIPTKRLEVQPWARYCLRCQELADQGLAGDSDFDEDEEGQGKKQIGVDIDPEDDEAHDEHRLVEGR